MRNELQLLRIEMEKRNISACLISTCDPHMSEYIGEHFKIREFISGFTGSAGTLLVGKDEAGLWTDGRYFLQAEDQLKDTGIELYKQGLPGVPSLQSKLMAWGKNGKLGFDGELTNARTIRFMLPMLRSANISFDAQFCPAEYIWTDRPPVSCSPVWELPMQYCGESFTDKISKIRKEMSEEKVDYLVLTALDEIAWLLNLRGNDVDCNPVFLSYAVIDADGIRLFAQKNAFSSELQDKMLQNGINLIEYREIFSFLSHLPANTSLWINTAVSNYKLFSCLPQGTRVTDKATPVNKLKCLKNPVEQQNERTAHLKDGAALTSFIYALKHAQDITQWTELSAARLLDSKRAALDGYVELSFDTISAYAHHGAIVHYEPTPATDIPLSRSSFLLVDSGAHYLEGTTDVTRTISLGSLTTEEKTAYTLVLKGNLNLGKAVFPKGCTGRNLDILARAALWNNGFDYNHGTGHGVGYLLNVHEGPNSIRWRVPASLSGDPEFCPGMLTSNEPGLYLEGKFGIRLENLILCQEAFQNDFGEFLSFETLTLVPFDRDAILPDLLTQDEKEILNSYHQRVMDSIGPLLVPEEQQWLSRECAPI